MVGGDTDYIIYKLNIQIILFRWQFNIKIRYVRKLTNKEFLAGK